MSAPSRPTKARTPALTSPASPRRSAMLRRRPAREGLERQARAGRPARCRRRPTRGPVGPGRETPRSPGPPARGTRRPTAAVPRATRAPPTPCRRPRARSPAERPSAPSRAAPGWRAGSLPRAAASSRRGERLEPVETLAGFEREEVRRREGIGHRQISYQVRAPFTKPRHVLHRARHARPSRHDSPRCARC